MKLVDQNGRLFGKINIIDFFIVIFLFCLLPVGFHIYNNWIKKSDTKEWVSVIARFSDVGPELGSTIKKGDIELDSHDKMIGKIVEVISIKAPEVLVLPNAMTTGKIYITGTYQQINKNVTVAMELLCRIKNRKFYYKDSIVKIGMPIIFSSEIYDITGEVIGFGNKP